MLAVDLHAHTRFFHGADRLGRAYDPAGAWLLARAARARGLDAVATTNHDYYRPFDGVDGLPLLPGIEVTTTRGHLLVVGPEPPTRTEPGALAPEEAVELAHDRGCAAVVAHPFRNSTVRAADADFDAVEVNGKGTEPRGVVERLADARDLPLVGGSDAHYPVEVGRAYTLVDADRPTPEAVVDAIHDGRVRARVADGPFHRTVRAAYRLVHGRKGWLGEAGPTPPGLGEPPGEERNRP